MYNNMQIWGRNFELPVIFKQFEGKNITETQKEAFDKIDKCEEAVNQSKKEVEKYILENGLIENGAEEVDNIFKYVMPTSFYLPKSKERTVAIMCNYKFDLEHGIAIVFENETFKEIGLQDIVL